ncbi:MAG: hypothetical protein K2W96_28740 [Gemmataceae bacterium]|nr:hypothetical protein [Gemmataceae bacterium]
MIMLTTEQVRGLAADGPAEAFDPTTNEPFVLLRKAEFDRLTQEDYDYGPMTEAERDILLAEMDAMLADDLAVEDEG